MEEILKDIGMKGKKPVVDKILKHIEKNGFLTLQNHYLRIPNKIYVKDLGFLTIIPEYDIDETSKITNETNYIRMPQGGYCLISRKRYQNMMDAVLIYLYSKPIILAEYLSEMHGKSIKVEDLKNINIINFKRKKADNLINKKKERTLKNNFIFKNNIFVKYKNYLVQVMDNEIINIYGGINNERINTCKSKYEREILHDINGRIGTSLYAMASR